MSFLIELRRRNVFKVGAAYVLVAWILAQVASVFAPALNLPDWATRFVVFLLIVGFPIALLLAWAYEVTPEGIKPTRSVPLAQSIRKLTGQWLNYVVTGLLVLAVAFVLVDQYLLSGGSPGSTETQSEAAAIVTPDSDGVGALPKVAVLPCDDLSANPDDAYFAAGIHEEILHQLQKVSGLLVVSRTSVLKYVDPSQRPGIQQIAGELGAQAVVECSVRHAGTRILVTAQLIDAELDVHSDSLAYEADLNDLSTVFELQASIAASVADMLEATLTADDRQRLAHQSTSIPEAYELYFRALAALDTTDRTGALRLFEQAIERDSRFALAYGHLAWLYARSMVDWFSDPAPLVDPDELERRALVNAERALSLDDQLAVAHLARAQLHEVHWRWSEAEREYAEAYALSPNDVSVLDFHAAFDTYRGRYDSAVAFAERAAQLHPGNLFTVWQAQVYAGDVDAALEALNEHLQATPADTIIARLNRGFVEARRGNLDRAVDDFRFVEQASGGRLGPSAIANLAYGYSRGGDDAAALRLFEELQQVAGERLVGPGTWAMAYLAIRRDEEALSWLDRALDGIERNERDTGFRSLIIIKANIMADLVLEEPRWRERRERIGGP